MKHDIFVSYSRRDSEIVFPIVDRLKDAGYSCWMDVTGIESSDEFKRVLVKAIRCSKVVLFFSSANSNSTEWTVKEINIAVQMRKPIIPIRLDDVQYDDSIFFDLSGVDYIPCHGGIGENEYRKLLKSIVGKCGDVELNDMSNNNLCHNELFLDSKGLSTNLDWEKVHIKKWYKKWRFGFMLVSCITVLIAVVIVSFRVYYSDKKGTDVVKGRDYSAFMEKGDDRIYDISRIHDMIQSLPIRFDNKELCSRLADELLELMEVESDWKTVDGLSDEKKLVELRKERDVLQTQIAVMATQSKAKVIDLELEGEIKEQVPKFRLYDKEEEK